MKCLTCGSVSSGNFCNKCGRPLRCPSCGSYDLNKFCGNCGKLIHSEEAATAIEEYTNESFIVRFIKNQLVPLTAILVIILTISYYFYSNSEETVNALEGLFHETEQSAKTNPEDPLYTESLSLIENLKFEEALVKLKEVSPTSPSYKKVQEKLDEIRFPLAQTRLDRAKELFAMEDYISAYQTLQQAYGAITPPLQEAMDLAPIYEKASYAQSMGKELAEEELAIPKKDYEFDDINARWTKSPEETDGYDWMEMTEKQKAYVISVIIFEWKKAGKAISHDNRWYADELNRFYEENEKGYNLTRALELVDKGKDAVKDE